MMDGAAALAQAEASLDIDLAALVAATSLWAAPETFRRLATRQKHGAWYPNLRRFSRPAGERKGDIVNGVRLDDNSYANGAAKLAIIGDRSVRNYAVCHVWPRSCYDERYHTSVANLVLVPSAISGLTDHDERTVRSLQYRAFELYGWHPEEAPVPLRPEGYSSNWSTPTMSEATRKALARLDLDQPERAFSGATPSDRLSFR